MLEHFSADVVLHAFAWHAGKYEDQETELGPEICTRTSDQCSMVNECSSEAKQVVAGSLPRIW